MKSLPFVRLQTGIPRFEFPACLFTQGPRNDVLTTSKAVTLCGGQRIIAKNLFWSQTICDPPLDFNAKGESTPTTRLQFAILHH